MSSDHNYGWHWGWSWNPNHIYMRGWGLIFGVVGLFLVLGVFKYIEWKVKRNGI